MTNIRKDFEEWACSYFPDATLARLTNGYTNSIVDGAWDGWQAAKESVEQPDSPCVEDDGCPTEKAVLQRYWRETQTPIKPESGWPDEETRIAEAIIKNGFNPATARAIAGIAISAMSSPKPVSNDVREAAIELLKHRKGELPIEGWLRDNDRSRKVLDNLAKSLIIQEAVNPHEASPLKYERESSN